MFKFRQPNGFTLIELMIVVAVIAIITLIAFPSYQQYVVRAKRAEGRAALLGAVQNLERFFTNNNTYTVDLAAAGIRAFSADTAAASAYTIAVGPGAAGIASSFVARAIPSNLTDPECGTLTYNQTGQKGMEGATATNVSTCW